MLVGIDIGGTFTDVVALDPVNGRVFLHKLPSTNDNPAFAALLGLREILAQSGTDHARLEGVSHGTTVATNAVLQSRYARTALVTTKGFRDVLDIGRQRRPDLWDIDKDKPDPIAAPGDRFEIDERLDRNGDILKEPPAAEIAALVPWLRTAGVEAVAVCFLHAYASSRHEERIAGEIRRRLPGVYVCTSAEVVNEFREYERFCSTVVNASLLPVMDRYLAELEGGVRDLSGKAFLRVMQSSGGTMSATAAREKPINTFLSGPSAGVIGAVAVAAAAGQGDFITLDVGGTSADVCLVENGQSQLRLDQRIAGLPVKTPTVDVHTVGTGGGSIAWIDASGLLKVGPQSAGATPGPACYGRGGTMPTVSDANQVLGRLNPDTLLGGRLKVDWEAANGVISNLAGELNLSPTEAAFGVIRIANAQIVQAIRVISVERGHDPRDFALLAAGGGGPAQAAEVARELGIRKVIVPANPGLLCAYGLLHSRQRADFSRTRLIPVVDGASGAISDLRDDVLAEVGAWRLREGKAPDDFEIACFGDFRYGGQDSELQVEIGLGAIDEVVAASLRNAFHDAHEANYGYAARAQRVELVAIRIVATGRQPRYPADDLSAAGDGRPSATRSVWFEDTGWTDTPIYQRSSLIPGTRMDGPAIIEQMDTSTLVLPGMSFTLLASGVLVLEEAE
ncbi:hydantoinase/oxoprolinase family protein [Rhodobium gokarnense]|uniref:N-methylhydantoinase A n=1 Tax=Rhodobium gokarnense TaxID=364296 RepID=A0ABT3H618_9HYPH|nr:hydantoinase/oxoprolinase family protein [Rhodobium gokarnense]MCW2305830.1 N-methylhydantoinase A [Rhodobium gokarnense]